MNWFLHKFIIVFMFIQEVNTVIWQAGTTGTSIGNFVLQSDGNLVLYDDTRTVVWASSTGNNRDTYGLEITDDGRLLLWSNAKETVLWEVGN